MRFIICGLLLALGTVLAWAADPVPGPDPGSTPPDSSPAPYNPGDAEHCANSNADNGPGYASESPSCTSCGICPPPKITENCTAGGYESEPLDLMPPQGGGGCGGCGIGMGSGVLPAHTKPGGALPQVTLVRWTRDNTGAYPFADQTHLYDVPLTQSYNATTGVTTLQIRLPDGGVRPTFTTTDGITFAHALDRSNTHGATMAIAGGSFIIRGPHGHAWSYPIPAGWSPTQNGLVIPVGTIADPQGYPITCTYDANGGIIEARGLLGSVTYTWGLIGSFRVITSATEPDGRTLGFAYQLIAKRPYLTATVFPDGSRSTYVYDPTLRYLPGYQETWGTSFTTRTVTRPNFTSGSDRITISWIDHIGRIGLVEDGMHRDLAWRPANGVQGFMWRLFQRADGSLFMPMHNGSSGQVGTVKPGRDAGEWNVLDAYNRQLSHRDELDRTTRRTYWGATHQVSSITYPDGTSESWGRQVGTGQPLSHTDRLGRTTTWERDARGLPTLEILPDDTPEDATDNFRRVMAWNDAGQLVRIAEVRPGLPDRVTAYFYCLSGQPADAPLSWDAPENHGLLVRQDAPGDAIGQIVSTTYRWDALRKDLVEMIDPGGHAYQWTYDALHRVVRADWSDGSYATWTYGDPTGAEAGLLLAERDRNGRVTSYAYDASGLRTAVIRPDGTRQDTVYDERGRVARVTDAGESATYGYDPATGRQVSVSRQANAARTLTTTTRFDSQDRAVATTDPYGRITGMVHDSNDQVVRTVRELVSGTLSWSASQAAVDAAVADTTWASADIGAVGAAGSTIVDGGSVILTAAGKGARSTQDAFRFHSQAFPGEGSITVYVDPSSTGRSGLMIRDGSAPGSVFLELVVDPASVEGLQIHVRHAENENTPWWHSRPSPIPRWLRLSRSSHAITVWTSLDGETWACSRILPLTLGPQARIGLCHASGTTGALATATFTNLSITKSNALGSVRDAAWAGYLSALPRQMGSNPAYVIEESAFDAAGRLLSRTDGRGVTTTYAYNARGWLSAMIEDATGVPATTAFTYDLFGNRLTVTSPRGVVERTTYSERNLPATITAADGTAAATVVSTRTYTPTGKLATDTDALNRVTTFVYGTCCDRLVQVIDPQGFITGFTYDFVGNRRTVTDGNSLTTTTTYDSRNRVATVTNAAAETTIYTYDDDLTDGVGIDAVPSVAAVLPVLSLDAGADGAAIAVTNPAGETIYEVHDGLGRPVASIDGLGHASTIVYDAVVGGLVETAQSDALGHVTRRRADGAGRVRQQVDALGQVATAGYDAAGNQLSQRDTQGIGWDAIYDNRNRLLARTTTRQDQAATTAWSYDLDGNRLAETDAEGHSEHSVYDQRNRRIQRTDRLGGLTRFAYDAVGNLTAISDADNEAAGGQAHAAGTTQYAYDARNLLIAEAFPSGQQGRTLRTYTYDGGRRLVSRQIGILSGTFAADAGFAGTPVATTYGHDAANRLTTRGYPDGRNDVFSHDAAGRLSGATSARYATTVARQYDAAGRLTAESLTLPDGQLNGTVLSPATYTVGYAYHADNTLASQTYPTGAVVSRTYTARHELATVALDGAAVSSRQHDAAGRLATATAGNGLVETRTYVPGDHLVASIAVPGVTGFGYAYDVEGRKLSESALVGSGQTFAYDAAGRLTGWTQGAATQSWDLSLVGDWRSTAHDGVAEPRAHTAVHEATQVGPTILTYDVAGNLTRDERQTALAWDPEHRLLRAIVTPDASPSGFGAVATYRYDALGRRVAKTVQNRTILYLPAGAQTVVELERSAIPSPAQLDGTEADGTLANAALPPASGGILPTTSGPITRVSFQPQTTVIPAGFLADTGKPVAVRTNGLTYGWSSDATTQAVIRHGAVALVEFDTHIQLAEGQTWTLALPNGTYPVVVVAGDPLSTQQTNHLTINGQTLTDPDPTSTPGYAAGDFDGWAVLVTITDGTLSIAPAPGAVTPKMCFVEIGPAGTTIAAETQTRLADLITRATNETGATPESVDPVTKEFVYGSYVDEVIAYQTTVGGVSQRYYPHYNSLYSVAALTDASGAVVERCLYSAYGAQTITSPGGAIRSKSVVGFDRGFTGHIGDQETGLLHARARQYSPTLGKYLGRNQYANNSGPRFATSVIIDRVWKKYDVVYRKREMLQSIEPENGFSMDPRNISFVSRGVFSASTGDRAVADYFNTLVVPAACYIDGFSAYVSSPVHLDPSGEPISDEALQRILEALERLRKKREELGEGEKDTTGMTACARSIAGYRKNPTPENCEAVCEDCGFALADAGMGGTNSSLVICILKCKDKCAE